MLWRHRLMAGALWLGESSAVSHRAAAIILGLDGIDAAPFEYSTRRRKRSSRPGVVVHEVRSLEPTETMLRQGFVVTSFARTIVDLAAVVSILRVERALESALRQGSLTLEELSEVLSRAPPTTPGRRKLRVLIEKHPGRATESDLEAVVSQVFRAARLPEPVRQLRIQDARGHFVARADYAFPEQRLIIEVDGYGSHSKLADWKRDRARQNALVLLGWIVYRVTWEDAHRRPDEVGRAITKLLEARSPIGREASPSIPAERC
jgi:very-short-patch-repair endonuclease